MGGYVPPTFRQTMVRMGCGKKCRGGDKGWAAGRLLLAGEDVVRRRFISWTKSQDTGGALGWGSGRGRGGQSRNLERGESEGQKSLGIGHLGLLAISFEKVI